ncbi:MAG: hypothetical protein AMXMBFR84_47620 [Candidatus Hydrogenedentota bacterium]
MRLFDRWNHTWFTWVHQNHLIYNTCWEDPRLDRVALDLTPNDTLVMITSAGCNALDYAIQGPRRIHAVDVNSKQNAVLELKMAGIRRMDYAPFFELFGRGRFRHFRQEYRTRLRPELSDTARAFWDDRLHYFDIDSRRPGFYFRGTSGFFARLINVYLDRMPGLRHGIDAILSAESIEAQRQIYHDGLYRKFWNPFIRWFAGQDTTLALLGVPKAQREQVERHYSGGIAEFIEQAIEHVFSRLPLGDNYFWRVYLTGEYTPTCCPEYLTPHGFASLKTGKVECIRVHTNTLEGFLRRSEVRATRFVLLDHMDWLSTHQKRALESEWQAIIDSAAPGTRVLWRSGGMNVDFVDPIHVVLNGRQHEVGELLTYNRELASELHAIDRVHTYGSFYIADLATA